MNLQRGLCKLVFSDSIINPFAYVSVYIKYKLAVPVSVEKKVIRSPGSRVTNSGELSHGCWELNAGPFQGQQILFSIESSLQTLSNTFHMKENCKK